jgi:hypothetical protein
VDLAAAAESGLSPEQLIMLGRERLFAGKGVDRPVKRLGRVETRIARKETRRPTPTRNKRIRMLKERKQKLLRRLGNA